MRAGIALGSNLGDRLLNLRHARRRIEILPKVRHPILASAIYETEPVDCEPGAQNFFNAVLEFEYDDEPPELLWELRRIEAELGRPAKHERNTSRAIDLDLLYAGDAKIDSAALQLPHPRISDRRFVLAPLAEIRPELILPNQPESMRTLLARAPESPAVVQLYPEW